MINLIREFEEYVNNRSKSSKKPLFDRYVALAKHFVDDYEQNRKTSHTRYIFMAFQEDPGAFYYVSPPLRSLTHDDACLIVHILLYAGIFFANALKLSRIGNYGNVDDTLKEGCSWITQFIRTFMIDPEERPTRVIMFDSRWEEALNHNIFANCIEECEYGVSAKGLSINWRYIKDSIDVAELTRDEDCILVEINDWC